MKTTRNALVLTAALALSSLAGCALTAYPGYVAVGPAPVVVEPAFVWFNGVYGFWYGGRFYDRRHWHPGFHGRR